MKKIKISEIPNDYYYYRSWFSTYLKYKKEIFKWSLLFQRIKNIFVWKKWFFWRMDPIFFWFLSIAKILKTQNPPTIDELKSNWMRHWIVFWSPWGKRNKSLDWWKKFNFFWKNWLHHANRSCFSILDNLEYAKKWSWNARNHLKHIQKNIKIWKITIWEVSCEKWISIYKNTILPHNYKKQHSFAIKNISKINKENIRLVLAYVDNIPLAWAAFLDEKPTSVYFVAFQDQSAKQNHLWLALIDWWFADSIKKGFKYLDFDHMRSEWDPISYKWYTQFKSELADFDVYFNEVWYRVF